MGWNDQMEDVLKQTQRNDNGELSCGSSPCWSFLWADYDDDKYPDGEWKSQSFECDTFKQACDMMVAWLQNECKAIEPVLDYEATADHLMGDYDDADHQTYYPRLDSVDHAIKDYVK